MNKLFLRRSVFVKRFTHEMTLRESAAHSPRIAFRVTPEVRKRVPAACPLRPDGDSVPAPPAAVLSTSRPTSAGLMLNGERHLAPLQVFAACMEVGLW